MRIRIDDRTRVSSDGPDGRPWSVQSLGKRHGGDCAAWLAASRTFETFSDAVDEAIVFVAERGCGETPAKDVMEGLSDAAGSVRRARVSVAREAARTGAGHVAGDALALFDTILAASRHEYRADGSNAYGGSDLASMASAFALSVIGAVVMPTAEEAAEMREDGNQPDA